MGDKEVETLLLTGVKLFAWIFGVKADEPTVVVVVVVAAGVVSEYGGGSSSGIFKPIFKKNKILINLDNNVWMLNG